MKIASALTASALALLSFRVAYAEPISRKCDLFAIGDSEKNVLAELKKRGVSPQKRKALKGEVSLVDHSIYFGVELPTVSFLIRSTIMHSYGFHKDGTLISIHCNHVLTGL
jgi:hypothetical protein